MESLLKITTEILKNLKMIKIKLVIYHGPKNSWKAWYRGNAFHRDDGPAVISESGCDYYCNGMLVYPRRSKK